MKSIASLITLITLCVAAHADPSPAVRLWDGPAPGTKGDADKDIPTLTPYLADPAQATGAAVVVLPGGGYGGLASHEGDGYARFLNHYGISAFVLKYRLGAGADGYRHPVMLQDASRAIRLVRARAADWKIDPKRVGIIGSSAGGHLASTILTHFDAGQPGSSDPVEQQSSRPDIGILSYAVISMGEITHGGSRRNLLGDSPSPELLKLLSNELQVTPKTPPCFIWHTWEDKAVKVENALEFAAALQRNGVPFDLHVYEKGPHGIGVGTRDYSDPAKFHPWTRDLVYWLKIRNFTR